MRSILPLVPLAVLLLASVASAQAPAPPTPTYTLVVSGAPAEFAGLTGANATSNAAFTVTLTLANVVCPADEVIPITLTAVAAGAPGFFSVAPEPSMINATIAAGPHLAAAGAASATGDSAAVVRITGNITANASVPVTIQAMAPAPTQCQGAGSLSAVTSEAVTVFANMTAPPPPVIEPTPEDDTPGLGIVAVAAVAAGVAFARRRRA